MFFTVIHNYNILIFIYNIADFNIIRLFFNISVVVFYRFAPNFATKLSN